MTIQPSFGQHHLVDFFDCKAPILSRLDDIKVVFRRAADLCGAHVLQEAYHQFDPHGVTAVFIIGESHLTLHTWPEHKFAAFDLLTCGRMDPQAAVDYLKLSLQAQRVESIVLERGHLLKRA